MSLPPNAAGSPPAEGANPHPRLVSVDALRGFDMFWIMGGDYLVRSLQNIHNSPATREFAAQMEHCQWAGFHFYDLIFPLFVFLVGISIVFSVDRMLEQSGKLRTIRRIVIRSVILFLLGIFYTGGVANGFANVYLAGVLHRIAVAYFFAALIYCFCDARAMAILCVALLLGYWVLLTFVPVPGIGPPSYEQGKNLAYYLDQHYLPGLKFEGTLLSTLAAVANGLLGVFAGLLLKSKTVRDQQKVFWLLGCGAASLAIGFAWGLQFPLIKLLWTSTYLLVACGYSAILLAIFYQIIEIWKWRLWAQPFVWLGMNALTIYITASMVNFRKLALRFVGGDIKTFLGVYSELVLAVVTLILVFWVVNFLYRRKIFLRL
jgi:predicted acyltransferase